MGLISTSTRKESEVWYGAANKAYLVLVIYRGMNLAHFLVFFLVSMIVTLTKISIRNTYVPSQLATSTIWNFLHGWESEGQRGLQDGGSISWSCFRKGFKGAIREAKGSGFLSKGGPTWGWAESETHRDRGDGVIIVVAIANQQNCIEERDVKNGKWDGPSLEIFRPLVY